MTTTTGRLDWLPADFGFAMCAYVEAHAKHVRRRADGVESEAFHREGDNPASLRVWTERGAFADARANVSGGARDFAKIVAGVELVEFMRVWGRGSTEALAPRRKAPEPVDLQRHRHECIGVWAGAAVHHVDDDAEVAAWLTSRGLDPGRIVDANVAGVIAPTAKLPAWAKCCGRGWIAGGYCLVVPLRDDRGNLGSLHARRITSDETLPKTASPAGVSTRGLVMTNQLARGLFAGADAVRDHVLAVSRETERPAVVVVEGLPSFLAWCTDASDGDEHAPAVVGILNGSWTAEHAARIPEGTRVVVDTDHGDKNGDGDRYAADIASTFDERAVTVLRATRTA
jgi:hypothetical protein